MQKSYIFALLFGLLFSSPLLEFHRAEMHNGGNNLVDVVFLNLRKAQNVKGFLCSVSTRSTRAPTQTNIEGVVLCVYSYKTRGSEKYGGFKVIKKKQNTPFPIGDGDDKTAHIKERKKKKKRQKKKSIRSVSFWPTYNSSISFSLLFATSLLELHLAHVHNSGRDSIDVVFLTAETQDVESALYFFFLDKWWVMVVKWLILWHLCCFISSFNRDENNTHRTTRAFFF